MAKTLKFAASPSPDVVGYRLYIEPMPDEVTYSSESVDLGNPVNDEGFVVIDLASLPEFTTKDGRFNIGVTSVDDADNESSMSKAYDVPLDFVAPDPPGVLELF